MNKIGNNRTKLDEAAKHLALRLCSGQTIALPESGICFKQTWVDFINSVRQPIKERDRFKIPLVVWIIDCLFPAPIGGFQKFILEGYRRFGEFLRLGQIEWHCAFPSITVDNRPSGLQPDPCVVGEQVRVVK